MSHHALATRPPSVSYEGVRIGNRFYSITIQYGHADRIARLISGGDFLDIWFRSKTPPDEETIAVLKARGFSLVLPHGRV